MNYIMIVALIPAGLVSWNPAKVQTRHGFSFQVGAELIRSTLNPVLGKKAPLPQATSLLSLLLLLVFFFLFGVFFLSRKWVLGAEGADDVKLYHFFH